MIEEKRKKHTWGRDELRLEPLLLLLLLLSPL
jgi:hypothetical protein